MHQPKSDIALTRIPGQADAHLLPFFPCGENRFEILQRCDYEICHQIFITVADALTAAHRHSSTFKDTL